MIEVMMVEELGIVGSDESPIRNGVVTFLAFTFFGLIFLLAYVLGRLLPYLPFDTFSIACVLTAATLFLLGATKARVTGQNCLKSGLETLAVGGVAALAAFLVGRLLGGFA